MAAKRTQRRYDHRLLRLVRDAGDATIATRIGVPRSTVAGWLRRPLPVVAPRLGEPVVLLKRWRSLHGARPWRRRERLLQPE